MIINRKKRTQNPGPNQKVLTSNKVVFSRNKSRVGQKLKVMHPEVNHGIHPLTTIIPSTQTRMLDFHVLQLRTAGKCAMSKNAQAAVLEYGQYY